MGLNYRWLVFAITFISYASTHACRQSFASAKDMMQQHWGFSEDFEGLMDGIFLMVYSLGLFSSGVMGDKFDTARFHAFGLFMTSLIYFIFAISVPYLKLDVHHYKPYYVGLFIINGLIQSIGWPTGVKLIGNWFTYSHPYQRKSWFIFRGYDNIGLIFGLWAAHQYVGNIIGIGYVSIVDYYGLDTQFAFYFPAIQAFIVATLVFYFVKTYPTDNTMEQKKMLNVAAENTDVLNQVDPLNPSNVNIGVPTEHLLRQHNDDMDMEMKGGDDDSDSDDDQAKKRHKAEYEYGVESDSDESVPSMEDRISFKKALKVFIFIFLICFFLVFCLLHGEK